MPIILPSTKCDPTRLSVIAMLMLATAVCSACTDETGKEWARHTIDDDYSGADGFDIADVDQDGALDIVAGWEESGLVIAYQNPGIDRVTKAWPKVDIGGGLHTRKVEDVKFADLDSDGAVDAVISATEMHSFKLGIHWLGSVHSWQSAAAWQGTWIDPQEQHGYLKIAIGQLDNAHGNDIVVGTKHKTVDGVSYGGKLIWFPSPGMLGPQHSAMWQGQLIAPIDWINNLRLSDLDGDGDEDVLLSDRVNGLHWFENRLTTKDGWIKHAIGPAYGDFAICRNVAGQSLGVVTYWGDWQEGPGVYYQNSAADWQGRRITIENSLPSGHVMLGVKGIACGDLDQNGTTDIVVSMSGEGHGVVAYLQGNDTWRVILIAGTDRNHILKGIKHDTLSLADLDADGDLDVVTTEENGGILGKGLGVIWFENPLRR